MIKELIKKILEYFKTEAQKTYIDKVYEKQGKKGIQKLINLSMKTLQRDTTNNLTQDEVEQVSKMLSKFMVD